VGSLVWVIALLISAVATPSASIGENEWLSRFVAAPHFPGVIVLSGLVLAGFTLPGTAFYAYYRSTLPEVGNRALLWVILAVLILCGAALVISGSDLLTVAGTLLLLMGAAGAVHAQAQQRPIDLRGRVAAAARSLALLALTASVVYVSVVLAAAWGLPNEIHAATLVAALALVSAAVYSVLRFALEWLLARIGGAAGAPDPTAAARKYSQQISKTLELKQLGQTVNHTLNETLGVRKSGLFIVNRPDKADGSVLLRLLNGAHENGKETRGKLSRSSPILQRWVTTRAPLTQYDIEFGAEFREASTSEIQFLRDVGMTAYAPIVVDGVLIGVLACSSKRDDSPFLPHELDLLATMADQTGVALRNARLVGDLRQLNDEMQVLNRGLEATKEQMEKLDAVKTDFITIASHELRTPLAQIRGYADLVDALNEQGMVDPDRVTSMVDNIRKATQRMEELIAAMLDVSQLDVKAMDLRFTQTSLEGMLRMAVEPLVDAARQRKLSLVARGLRGLPVIEADMQRLVQAFRNVIVNAIKFTPDGGRIDISAEMVSPADGEGDAYVLVKVADTGVGIDKENLELIFHKFYRASDPNLHSTGAYKFLGAGPGLGLTIAKGVIEGHGGKIWVESPGHDMERCPGSTFFIQLPLSHSDQRRHVMTFPGPAAAGGQPESSSAETTLVRMRHEEMP
jgi:signal transduction histidine kinase